jgi:hypothetical protein
MLEHQVRRNIARFTGSGGKHIVTWCSGVFAGSYGNPACTVKRMPQFEAKMPFTLVIYESRKWNFRGYQTR